jgi:hypothetical protein
VNEREYTAAVAAVGEAVVSVVHTVLSSDLRHRRRGIDSAPMTTEVAAPAEFFAPCDNPYEAPETPEIVVNTTGATAAQAATQVVTFLS